MTSWLTAAELAGLVGMPSCPKRAREWLDRINVPSRTRPGKGGGREFDCSALPAQTRQALLLAQIDRAPLVLPAQPEAVESFAVSAQPPVPAVVQRQHEPSRADAACADARVQIVRRLADMAEACFGITEAAKLFSHQLATAQQVSAEQLDVARAASQRPRLTAEGGVSISVRTLFAWHGAWVAGGWWALIPKPVQARPLSALGDDVAAVLRAFSSASGAARNLTHCAQRVNDALGRPFDDWYRLYKKAHRALPKADQRALIKARHTGAERAARLPFKRRDTSTIAVLDVAVVDGHTFKAKVRHPDHGGPFAPEVTVVLDAKTRRITGWSASLSENTIAVGDAIRHAVGQHGVPAMVYSDNGAGERAKAFDCPVAGLFARLGTEHRTGIPGHPQGHGIIERSWQTHMLRCARQFATYQGRDADSRTVRNVGLELQREQRALKRAESTGEVVRLSAKAPSWQQFLDAVAEAVAAYNSRHRHRSLPKHASGPHAGRHMTPDEAWEAMLDPADQMMLDGPTLRHVFMPAVMRVAQRGEMRFLNQVYFSEDLMQVDGQHLRLHYDIHDASRVWVWTVEGAFVCEAVCGANRMGYMPKPAVDMSRERRVRGMVKRREQQIETALAELRPTVPAAPPLPLLERTDAPAATAAEIEAPAPVRPFFDTGSDRYEWLLAHRDQWGPDDAPWLAAYVASDSYAELAEYFATRGLSWTEPEAFKTAG